MNYILYFDYSAIGICLLTILFLITRKDMNRTDNKILLVLVLMNLLSAGTDIFAVFVQSDLTRYGLTAGVFWNTAYLIIHTQMAMVLTLYVIALLGIRDRLKKAAWMILLFPSVIVLFILSLNPFLGWYFYYNEQNVYTYGPMTVFIYVCPILQLSMMLVLLYRYRSVLQKAMFIAIISFFVATMLSITIQYIHKELLIELYMQSLGLLGMMLAVENKDEIRSLVNAVEALETERKKADDANRSKSDFLANMSHEIRTPINAVLGMNEMILRDVMQSESNKTRSSEEVTELLNRVKAYATDIKRAGQSLLSIINDILDFSKIESGRMDLVEEAYRISSVLIDVSNMIMFRASSQKLQFHVNVDETIPDGLFGDEVRIRQVITNLLTNAVKYTEKGSVTLTVGSAPSQAGDDMHDTAARNKGNKPVIDLIISVKDTGIGIRDEDMKKLFGKFERIDLKKNNTVEGTGLGLAITKSLLHMMGGSIRVNSEYGVGSEFIVTIPQAVVDTAPVGNLRIKHENKVYETTTYQERFRAPDARILVVDDTAVNLTVIKGLLKETRLKINTATSGKQALEMTQDIPFDVILLDQRMPEMDGTETLEKIRGQQSGVNTSTPVIALTADAVQGAKMRYIASGFSDFLSKPVDGLKLEKMLMQYLPEDKVQHTQEDVSL